MNSDNYLTDRSSVFYVKESMRQSRDFSTKDAAMALSLVDLEGATLQAAERNGSDLLLKLDSQLFSEETPEALNVKVGFRLRGVEFKKGEFKGLPKEINEFDMRCGEMLWAVHLPPDYRYIGECTLNFRFKDGQEVQLSATEAAIAVAPAK